MTGDVIEPGWARHDWGELDDLELLRIRGDYLANPRAAITSLAGDIGRGLPPNRVTPRADLAARADCPADVMDLLALDTPTVRLCLVSNHACSGSALEIAVRITMRADRPLYWMTDWTMIRAIRHGHCPGSLSRRLAREGVPLKALQIANCPADLVSALSRHGDEWVRVRAIHHRRLPAVDLIELCSDDSTLIARAALGVAVRRVPEAVQEYLAAARASTRRVLMRRVATSVQERFADGPDPRLRYTVAQVTESVPTLERLAADDHGRVRRAATARLLQMLTPT